MKQFVIRVVERAKSRFSGKWETVNLLNVRIQATTMRAARDIVRGAYRQPKYAIGKTWEHGNASIQREKQK